MFGSPLYLVFGSPLHLVFGSPLGKASAGSGIVAGAIGSPAANAGAMGSSAVGCDWHRVVGSSESAEQGS